MDVNWGDVGIIVNLLSIGAGILVVVLAAHLKKYFPGRDEVASQYVDKENFEKEMQKLRDDLHATLGNHANTMDHTLREGIASLRDQVNGMGPRIQSAHDKANLAEGIATRTLEMLARVESDSGGLRSEIGRLTESVSKMREDLGYIKGRFEKQT